ncbi:MAG TPA: hypothetical protein VI385_09880 [Flavisolibacter sp.]|jgi:hypothetical protein
MKKLGILLILGMLMACNNTSTLENKADSLAKHVDSASERLWDSGKKDVKELKEKIKGEFKKDSVTK